MQMVEQWKQIPGWEAFEISDMGGVRRAGSGKRLKTHINDKGYPTAHLRMDGREKQLPVHVAILLAFVGPKPTPEHQGAHGDGVRANSILSNLRWATPKENTADMKKHGTQTAGEAHHTAVFSASDLAQVFPLHKEGKSYSEIGAIIGCSAAHVRHILRGERRLDAQEALAS